MKAIALVMGVAVVAAPRPNPPTSVLVCMDAPRTLVVIEDAPAIYADPANNQDQPGRVIRADGKALYTFTDYGEMPAECVLERFPLVVEDPDIFAPPPPVDPDFDEHSPTGPVDGLGEGPGQGTPADTPNP